jgi:hypothetical protein
LSNPITDLSPRSRKTIDILVETGVVPTFTTFDITEEMIAKSIETYGSIGPKGNGKFNYGLARKIHGLNLLKLKFSRGAKAKDCKEGQIYLIANPAWPDHLKIGMTVDTEIRLASYQTYDPYKRFRIKHYDFVLDRRGAEKKLLDEYGIHSAEGEWIKYSDALEIIRTIRRY